MPDPSLTRMTDLPTLIGKLSLNNYYEVNFSGFGSDGLRNHLSITTFKGDESQIINDLFTRKLGLLCSDASLPSSSFATAEVKDNFMGVTQEFAHTRIYTDLDFTFYVDNEYGIMRLFEGWMDYISGGGEQPQDKLLAGYYRRFVYPDNYKVNTMSITKFERNYKLETSKTLKYTFINAFPKSLTPVSLTYGSADILKVTVTFNYDRYIVERKTVQKDATLTLEEIQRRLRQQGAINRALSGEDAEGLRNLALINEGRRLNNLSPISIEEFYQGGF